MINQIVSNSADKNIFAPLQNNSASYAIAKPFTKTQDEELKNEKEKKSNTLGYNIASIALIAGLGVFALTRLLSKRSHVKFDKLTKFLEDKVAKLSENKKLTNFQNFGLLALNNTKALLKKSRAIFTFATLKDMLFWKAFNLHPALTNFNKNLTNLFEKVSIKTSKKSYSKTLVRFDSMFADFAKANIKMPDEKVKILEQKIQNVRANYTEGFCETARNHRFAKVKEGLNDLGIQVWNQSYKDIAGLIEKSKQGKFLAEELAAHTKVSLNTSVVKMKNRISISVDDNYKLTSNLVDNIDAFIETKDLQAAGIMRKLRTHLNDYKKILEKGEEIKNIFPTSDVAKDLSALDSYISTSGKYSEKTTKDISDAINKVTQSLNENKKGEIQEIMGIYKQHLSGEEYAKLEKSVNKALISLDKSIDLETDKLFDKIRDLQLGSAPHDVLAILSSFGLIAWGVSKADNKDEKISVTLKYGIPALFGVITAVWCALGLIASGPSLLIGLVSTIPINKLGEFIDNKRKKYKEEPPTLGIPTITLKSPTDIIKDINDSNKLV